MRKRRRFITYSYYLFPVMLVVTLVLTFSAKNNFTADFDNQIGVMSDQIRSKTDIEAFARRKLIDEFRTLRAKSLGEAAGDCFDHKLIFNYHYPEEETLPFYKDQMVSARVVEQDCDREYYLYSLKIYFDEQKLLVQTTAFDEWQTPEEYLTDYKQRIKKEAL